LEHGFDPTHVEFDVVGSRRGLRRDIRRYRGLLTVSTFVRVPIGAWLFGFKR
jgi:hypothetical protein